jgi:hypothetical protein
VGEEERHQLRDVLCIFEDGDEHQAELITRARDAGFNAIPQAKKGVRAFDACDLAAWKARTIVDDHYVKNKYGDGSVPIELLVASLDSLEMMIPDNGRLSLTGLQNICMHLQTKKRTIVP